MIGEHDWVQIAAGRRGFQRLNVTRGARRLFSRRTPRVTGELQLLHGQVIAPSTVDEAPPPTWTLQLVIVLEIELLLAATV